MIQGDLMVSWARTREGFTYIEDSIEELTGFSAEEILAQPGRDMPPDTEDRLLSLERHIFSHRVEEKRLKAHVLRLDMRHRDDYLMPVEFILIALYEAGWPTEVVGLIRPCHDYCIYLGRLTAAWMHLDQPARKIVADMARALCVGVGGATGGA